MRSLISTWCAAVAVAVGATGAVAQSQELVLEPAAEEAAARIDEDTLAAHVRFLSSDLLEGRAPAGRGDELARRYIATELESIGLRPGGPDRSWEQPFDVVSLTSEVPERWTFRAGDATVDLAWWEEFVGTSGVQEPAIALADAELVFVGYGIQAPEYAWDDFAGSDLRGKVLLMLNDDPDWDPDLFAGERRLYYGRWSYKYESAARQGAVAALIVHTTPSAGYPWQVVQNGWSGEQFELPAGDEPRLRFAAWTTEAATRRLLELAGHDLDALALRARERSFVPVPLGIRTSLEVTTEIARKQTANVLGELPGSDPDLADEVVVYTAHHDHLGIGEPDATGDAIYNGALDNASGVAQVLAAARAYAELPRPPRRSVLFLFVGAEESGLLGSRYYARHPTYPLGRIAANVNIDGGNIWGRTTDVPLIGRGKSTLDTVAEAVARYQGRTLVDEPFPDRGFFYRSDQFNFAKIGVPALYFETGTHFVGQSDGAGEEHMKAWEAEHYHRPSDELTDAWSFAGMIEDARLAFLCGLLVAEADALPSWLPGDEFEAARERALVEVGP